MKMSKEEELKELKEEEEVIVQDIKIIMHINHIEGKEKDELWTLINKYADNQREQEELCGE